MNRFKDLLFVSGIVAMMIFMLPVNLQAQDSNVDEVTANDAPAIPCKGSGKGHVKGHGGGMPSFQDIDTDGDGRISEAEFEAHKQEHRAKMKMDSDD